MAKFDSTSIVFNHLDATDLDEIGTQAQHLETHFGGISLAKQVKQSVIVHNEDLSIVTEAGGYAVTISHFGTSIRFELLLTFDDNGTPLGKVICMFCHSIWVPARRELLGEFTFSRVGTTSLPLDESGRPRQLPHDADIIVAHFLRKAHAVNRVVTDFEAKP